MPAKTKTFDCVQMKHDIQEQMSKETERMSPEERRHYMQTRAIEFRHHIGIHGKGNFKALFASEIVSAEKCRK